MMNLYIVDSNLKIYFIFFPLCQQIYLDCGFKDQKNNFSTIFTICFRVIC